MLSVCAPSNKEKSFSAILKKKINDDNRRVIYQHLHKNEDLNNEPSRVTTRPITVKKNQIEKPLLGLATTQWPIRVECVWVILQRRQPKTRTSRPLSFVSLWLSITFHPFPSLYKILRSRFLRWPLVFVFYTFHFLSLLLSFQLKIYRR